MEQITLFDVFWLVLAQGAVLGLLLIASAFVTGWLVFRAKRESHERLLGPKRRKPKGPVNIDEFSTDAAKDDDDGLPDIIAKQNERIVAEMARSGMRKGGDNG